MKVSEIMSSEIGTIRMDGTLRDAAKMMVDCDCGAIPVVEDDQNKRLIGLITDRDIAVRAVAKGLNGDTRVSECMSTDIATIQADASVEEVERIMEDRQVRRVPVVDAKQCVCGMVSQADIALARPASEAAEVVQEVSRPYVT